MLRFEESVLTQPRPASFHDPCFTSAKISTALLNEQVFWSKDVHSIRCLEQVIASIEDSLRDDFQVPYVSLILFSETPRFSNARCVTHSEAREAIGHLLDSGKTLSGVLRPHELTFLFGEAGSQVASTALSPIQHQGTHGVIALGSRDANHYRNATGTLFLGYIADALARVLLRQRPLADEGQG